jgi:hypothetical protein
MNPSAAAGRPDRVEVTIMRAVSILLVLGLILAAVSPVAAAVVLVTAAAPLEDESEQSVQAALDQAVGLAVRDAVLMGLRPVKLTDAQIWVNQVVVEILATDVQPDEGDVAPVIRPTGIIAQTF